jgi:phospholipid-binding lipoprotein MlaA
MKILKSFSLAISVLFLTACASSIDPVTGQRQDPLEGFNRAMWKVNYNYLDPYVLKPAAKGWQEYVPSPVRTGLTNVANNLDEPASFVNRILEGEGRQAMVHFNRFWINSVFGLGGLIDWASLDDGLRLDKGQREFGDTLGTYGVGSGSYLMIPGYGATTPRQVVGKIADSSYPVLSLLTFPMTAGKFVVQGLDSRAKLLGQDSLLQQSSDPYVTFREAYFQNMEFKVKDGKTDDNGGQETLSEEELKNID